MRQALLVREQGYDDCVDASTLIARLAQKRNDLKIKQAAVAHEMGVSQQAISHLEASGAPKVPWDTLRAYADAIGYELVVEMVEEGTPAQLVTTVLQLDDERAALALRFARLIAVMEPRDLRRKAADATILEEDYGLTNGTPQLQIG